MAAGEAWARRLEQENSRLSNEKRELERQLAEKKRTAQVSSTQVLTLGHKVRELERQNTGLSGELSKQREDTRKAGLLFISAADRYQEEAKKQIRAKAEELENTRKAGLMLMNTADTYQEAARKQIKEKAEELEDARKAVLALMKAADAYQEEAKKKIKDKEQELKVMGAQKAELDKRVESLESRLKAALAKNLELEDDYGKVKAENDNLRLEVEKDASAKAFDAEKEEILTELEDLKMKVEERIITGGNTINTEANLMWDAAEGNTSSVANDKAALSAPRDGGLFLKELEWEACRKQREQGQGSDARGNSRKKGKPKNKTGNGGNGERDMSHEEEQALLIMSLDSLTVVRPSALSVEHVLLNEERSNATATKQDGHYDTAWFMDSGVSNHMCGRHEFFSELDPSILGFNRQVDVVEEGPSPGPRSHIGEHVDVVR
ncbi:hypothetical protein TRIUR3_21450 [Triticum urartu]|uniref:Uncharacterized protein n=1 Tax=Triticum urartu TaxID=4572 RepID=M7Z016_TRIUA|nr:hypothetical protein TRIUR3_21450 [Triticum urartu]